MTAFVRFVKTLAPGLVVLEFEGNGALWSRSRIRIAGKTCAVSGRPLAVGDLA